MPELPAICRTCGTVFGSGLDANNVKNLTITNYRAGPCPKCGGVGEIPDGVYEVIGQAINVLTSSSYSSAQLERIADVLRESRQSRTEPSARCRRARTRGA